MKETIRKWPRSQINKRRWLWAVNIMADNETEVQVSKALGQGHSSVSLWLRRGGIHWEAGRGKSEEATAAGQALTSLPAAVNNTGVASQIW